MYVDRVSRIEGYLPVSGVGYYSDYTRRQEWQQNKLEQSNHEEVKDFSMKMANKAFQMNERGMAIYQKTGMAEQFDSIGKDIDIKI